jgi:multidrug transporter EmrE-like cation transporter
MNSFFIVILAIVLTEAITELVVKSEIFRPLRAKIFNLGGKNKFFSWLHNLLDCGYCFSVWAGWAVAFLFLNELKLFNPYVDWFIVGVLLHRGANLFHNIMDRIHGVE